MEVVNIGGKQYTIFGKLHGANDNKFNRAAKLAHNFNILERKFTQVVENNPITTDISRYSLACLMLMFTGIRIGNEDSAEGYQTNPNPHQKNAVSQFVQTFGLTTLKKEHFISYSDRIEILFLGKRYVDNSFTIKEPVLVQAINRLLEANKTNDGYLFGITDSLLTKFIKSNVGQQFSAKDFRTLKANLEAWSFLDTISPMFMTKANKRSQMSSLFTYVSNKLNNTAACAKKNYVSPQILPYMDLLFT